MQAVAIRKLVMVLHVIRDLIVLTVHARGILGAIMHILAMMHLYAQVILE